MVYHVISYESALKNNFRDRISENFKEGDLLGFLVQCHVSTGEKAEFMNP